MVFYVDIRQCVICTSNGVLCWHQAVCYVDIRPCVVWISSCMLHWFQGMLIAGYLLISGHLMLMWYCLLCWYQAMGCGVETRLCVVLMLDHVLYWYQALCWYQAICCIYITTCVMLTEGGGEEEGKDWGLGSPSDGWRLPVSHTARGDSILSLITLPCHVMS